MKVTVKLFGNLRKKGSAIGEPFDVDLPKGCLAGTLSKKLELIDVKLIFVNNVNRENDWVLCDDDEVIFFPVIAGG